MTIPDYKSQVRQFLRLTAESKKRAADVEDDVTANTQVLGFTSKKFE